MRIEPRKERDNGMNRENMFDVPSHEIKVGLVTMIVHFPLILLSYE
jgi:hypothetical protein